MSDHAHDGPFYRKLHWQIAIGLVLALIYAFIVRQVVPIAGAADPEAAQAIWVAWAAPFVFAGQIFMNALLMLIVPLVVASVIEGIRSMGDAEALGKLGAKTVLYYFVTTFLAVVVGLIVVNIMQPGVGLDIAFPGAPDVDPKPLSDVFAAIVPSNIIGAWASNAMLPSIFVAILLGIAILKMGDEVRPIAELFSALNALIMRITDWIMKTAPVGVAGLFVGTLLNPELADLGEFFGNVGMYMATVGAGLAVHSIITLPALLYLFTRRSPIAYLRAMTPALLTSFSTASSSASYPVTLECAVDGAGVPRPTASFVLPLGATINMDGTALYEAVAVIFIANVVGQQLDFATQATVAITATLAAVGAAGVPSAGLVTLVMVLGVVGLPIEAAGIIIGVDRILDMGRTTVNVWGDSIGAAVVAGPPQRYAAAHAAPAT